MKRRPALRAVKSKRAWDRVGIVASNMASRVACTRFISLGFETCGKDGEREHTKSHNLSS